MDIAVEFDPETGTPTHGIDRHGNSVRLKPSEAARATAKGPATPAPMTEAERLAARADVRRRAAEREAVEGELRRLSAIVNDWREQTGGDEMAVAPDEVWEARRLRDDIEQRVPRVSESRELFALGRADLLLANEVASARCDWAERRVLQAKRADDTRPTKFTAANLADARAEHARTQQLHGVAYWAVVNE